MTRNVLRAVGYSAAGYLSLVLSRQWTGDSDVLFASLLVLIGVFGELFMTAMFPPTEVDVCQAVPKCPYRRMCVAGLAAMMALFGFSLIHGAVCLKASCHQ